MKTNQPSKTYDSIEYGILLPDTAVKPDYQQQPRRHRRRVSWCKCLCITLLVLLATFFLTTIVIGLCGYFWTKHQVKKFTTKTPVHYPIHELPDAELEIVKDRVKLFYDSILAGVTPEEDLVITEDELNGFVAHSDYLRGNAQVLLTEKKFGIDMSLPAQGLPGGKGRYFVATGSMTFSETDDEESRITAELETLYPIEGLDDAKLFFADLLAYVASDGTNTLNIQSGHFYKWVIPEEYIAKKENLLDHLCDDDDDKDDEDCRQMTAFLNGIGGVSITNEKIAISARSSSNRQLGTKETPLASDNTRGKSFGNYIRRALAKSIF